MFRNEVSSEIQIDAASDEVWSVLTDLDRYGEWNPGFSAIEGRIETGATLRVTFERGGGKTMTLRPKILSVDPGRDFRWLGRLVAPGLFDGEHRFEIHEIEPGRVRFVQSERFRGLLVPFVRKMIEVETKATFEKVNAALAARVEAVRVTS